MVGRVSALRRLMLLYANMYEQTSFVCRLLQAMDGLMPGFDKEIAKMAQRVLINPRKIDWYTGVLATKVTPG